MAIFKMPAGVRRRLESVMRGFFWRGPRQEGLRGVALVAWETVCRPVSQGGLGVPHLQQANMALLTKWVARLMHPSEEMVVAILCDGYGASLDWQRWQTSQRGDSAFMSSLRPIFKSVQPFFLPKLGTWESFRFWADEWSGNGRLKQSLPRLFALALDPEGSVRQAWQNAWALALPSALSDQRMLDFMRL